MAIRDSNKAVLSVAADKDSTPDTVSQLTSTAIDQSAEVHSARHMTSNRPEYFLSYTNWSMSGEGLWERADNGQAMLLQGNTVYVNYMPEGNTTGKPVMSGSAIVTSANFGAQMDNALQVSFSLQGQGELVQKAIAVPSESPKDEEINDPPGDQQEQQDQQDQQAQQPPKDPPVNDPPKDDQVNDPPNDDQVNDPPQGDNSGDGQVNDPPQGDSSGDGQTQEEHPGYEVYTLGYGAIQDDNGVDIPYQTYAYDTDNNQLIVVEWDSDWVVARGYDRINVSTNGHLILTFGLTADSYRYVPRPGDDHPGYYVYSLPSGSIQDDNGVDIPSHIYAYDTDNDQLIPVSWDSNWAARP